MKEKVECTTTKSREMIHNDAVLSDMIAFTHDVAPFLRNELVHTLFFNSVAFIYLKIINYKIISIERS
jgi:hypothetical protein